MPDFLRLAEHSFTVTVDGEDIAVGLPSPEQRAEIGALFSKYDEKSAAEQSRIGTRLAAMCLAASIGDPQYSADDWERIIIGSDAKGGKEQNELANLASTAMRACGFNAAVTAAEDRIEQVDDAAGNSGTK